MQRLGHDDHVGAVLAVGIADQVLDAREVALDLAERERGLDDGDAGHAATSSAMADGSGTGAASPAVSRRTAGGAGHDAPG